jgi:predicted phage terminase large subunit-like protein
MLLYAWSELLGFPELLKRTKEEMKHRYGRVRQPIIKPLFGPSFLNDSSAKPPDIILIEDKVSGISLRQVLAAEGLPAFPYNPGRASKLLRLHTVSHLFSAGRVWVPESEVDERVGMPVDWAEAVLDQLTTFAGEGTIAHDDHVDAATQLLRYVYDKEIGTISMVEDRRKDREDEEDRVIRRVVNPYAA